MNRNATPPIHSTAVLDVERIRRDFPALHQEVNGKPLAYLDNAASAQTPQPVLDAIMHFYTHDRANIHRGVHALSQRATKAYEEVRHKIAKYLNAKSEKEIVFVRGATEAINLVAHSFGGSQLKAGDEILISALEHHSNIVPWQLLSDRIGTKLKVIPIDDRGAFSMEMFTSQVTEKTRMISLIHMSNALGTINPVREIIEYAHARGIPVMLDGAQAAPHMPIDVQDLDVDFYAISAHKMFGPTGIGVLYGKYEHLKAMPPYEGGGDMIRSVTFEKSLFAPPPARFEAGTPHIAGVIGFGAAIDYIEALGWDAIEAHEASLLDAATRALSDIPQVRLVGTAPHKGSVVSFMVEGIHPHDLGTIMDSEGVAIRAGHHCAQPIMERFGIPATARASFSFYNTHAEIDALVRGIRKAIELFR